MADRKPTEVRLGDELRLLREAHGLSLRAVERSTEISNAYLSQLETGKIEKPSPNILHKLAELYSVSYDYLMELAGYVARKNDTASGQRQLSGAALAVMESLTPEEEKELMNYLLYLRSRRSSAS